MLEKPIMDVTHIQFNFWIFFSNAVCALALNFSIFLVIGRTGAVTIRVAGVLKDWILIALSTVIFPESAITGLNIIGYAIGILSGSSMCNIFVVALIGFIVLVCSQVLNMTFFLFILFLLLWFWLSSSLWCCHV